MDMIKSGIMGGLLIGAISVNAVTYSDLDIYDELLTRKNQKVVGTFNIADGDGDAGDVSGFDPLLERVKSATIEFELYDDQRRDSREKVKISLDNWLPVTPTGGVEVDQSTTIAHELTIRRGAMTMLALLSLNRDGIISYAIRRGTGDFYVGSASLTATAVDRTSEQDKKPPRKKPPHKLPDAGSTLSLAGLAFLGMAWAGRRKERSQRKNSQAS